MIFEPVKMYGRILVDGGIMDNIPIDICRSYKADVVIAVDIMADIDSVESIDNFVKVGYKSLLLAIGQNKKYRLAQADVVIAPNLKKMPMLSSKNNQQVFDSGYIAAKRMIPDIIKAMRVRGIPD
jgi:NTE family protein